MSCKVQLMLELQANASTKHKSKQMRKQMQAQIQIAKQGEDGSKYRMRRSDPGFRLSVLHQRCNLQAFHTG